MTNHESPDFNQEILLERYQVQQELSKSRAAIAASS